MHRDVGGDWAPMVRWLAGAVLGVWRAACGAFTEEPSDASRDGAPAPDGTLPDGGAPEPRFVEVAAAAGLAYQQRGPPPVVDCAGKPEPLQCIARLLTGGATVGDYDGDGWPDVYATRLDGPDRLFRNQGDGTFEEVSSAAGVDLDASTNGAAFGDVDDDGDLDLLVTSLLGERNLLYINQVLPRDVVEGWGADFVRAG